MSEPAEYTFVPWVRAGYRPTGGGSNPAEVAVTLSVGATGEETLDPPREVETVLSLYGPGEVTGIDRRQVVRTEPEPGTSDFPPNYFPAVEFDRPDLPWLFSPESDGSNARLRPWICLITVEHGEGVSVTSDDGSGAPVLEISDPASPGTELPDLSESWAWAHAQEVGAGDTTAALRTDRSEKTLSRLVSPRKLTPNTEYYACVVPAYEPGRRSGLGENPYDGGDRTFEDAWDASNPPGRLRLPVYYHWRFSTGEAGDFESLVRRLAPETLRNIGIRPVDAGDPGPSVLRSDGEIVSLEGALRSTNLSPDTYDPSLRTELEGILDAASSLSPGSGTDDGVPVVGPPTYGQWPPAAPEIPDDGADPAWLRDLNVDPRYRIPAGFGTDVVQDQQEQLMHSAWQQIGDVRRANQLLRRARLAREASRSIHDALGDLRPASTLSFTEPLHGRTTDGSGAIAAHVESSAFAGAVLSPAFRRVMRPTGPLARRFGGLSPEDVVDGIAAGTIAPGDTGDPPDGTQTLADDLAGRLCERARTRGRIVERWHPLGDFADADPDEAAKHVRESCQEFRWLAEEARETVDEMEVDVDFDQFVEPLMGVCSTPEQEFETDLVELFDAIGDGDRERAVEVLSRIYHAVDQAVAGHEALKAEADSEPMLREILEDDPGLTPAFERFLDDLRRLTLLIYPDVLSYLCTEAIALLEAIEKSRPRDAELLEELHAICTAVCGSEAVSGSILDRLLEQLRAGATRDLRQTYATLQQLLGMARRRIAELGATDDDRAVEELGQLADTCETFARLADVLGGRLADAPWSPAADAVGPAACPAPDPDVGPPLDLADTAVTVADVTRPAVTIPERLGDRLGGVDLSDRPDPLDQILAHPEFKQPMYEPLRDLSQEHLLPGIGEVPFNTVGVLETNPAFIESYMLGLSHEMARELRWREYPTDLRGTYFRQFWNPEGRVPPLSDEARKDIDYVHRWNDSLGLGGNYAAKMAAKTGGEASVGGQLVLLVRGEVFDRYPNTHVYAAKALENSDGDGPTREPDLPDPATGTEGTTEHPIFRGTLDPDVTFFGFDLTEADALADPGWFFVIEEPPSEPTFGLDIEVDDPEESGPWGWEDLTWDDVSADGYLVVGTPPSGDDLPESLLSPPEWARNSAHMAEITWQRPYRIAIHADDMIPQNGGPP